jgi:hypothetical protein
VEQYLYSKAPDNNYSFSKKQDGKTEWQTATSSLGLFNESLTNCLPIPTATPFPTETPIPVPTITSIPTLEPTQTPTLIPEIDYQNIYISEVYPYPQTDEHEWVELYNGNSNEVNLEHWYIDDMENGGSTPKSFSLKLDPNTYGVIELSSSLFNNSGDSVRLLDMNKNEKDSMEYGKITQGKSMGRISFSEDLYCEQDQSKNTTNSSCVFEPTQIPVTQNMNKNVVISTPKNPSPVKKVTSQIQKNINANLTNSASKAITSKQTGQTLGIQIKEVVTSPIRHLSFVSFSYSLLTIVSIFIKMKNA